MNENNSPAVAELNTAMVVITRVFDAPRELVFRAWTDSEQLPRWYAPDGCTIEFRHIDIRQGGTFHSCIRTPGGFQCWCIGEYREIVAPERIVFTMVIADEQGRRTEATTAGHVSEWPVETVVTVLFAEQEGRTKLTLQQNVSESLAKQTGAYPSWIQMLDHLAQQLSKKD